MKLYTLVFWVVVYAIYNTEGGLEKRCPGAPPPASEWPWAPRKAPRKAPDQIGFDKSGQICLNNGVEAMTLRH